jgi:HrpA-like RNA helicase
VKFIDFLALNKKLTINVAAKQDNSNMIPLGNRKAKNEDEDERAHRKESQFATHLKASKGSSSFSRTKSLKEQRQYLPAFACREGLLQVIRENQGLSRSLF